MAKAAINKKYSINASGILHVDGDTIAIENVDTGELIYLAHLAEDFADKTVKVSFNYDEDYDTI